MAKTVLMIAYLFPPAGGVGAIRPTKFARYLPEFGWNVVVLTVNKPGYAVYDQTLAEQLPDDLPIYRTRSIEPTSLYFALKRRQSAAAKSEAGVSTQSGGHGRLLGAILKPIRIAGRTVMRYTLFPDDKIGWQPFAVRAGRKIIKQHNIDVIYTCAPPYSVHSIGTKLSKQTAVPLVLDFRDSFVDEDPTAHLSRYHMWRATRLERNWVNTAKRVITVTPPMTRRIASRYRQLPDTRWTTVMNGYDEADFADVPTRLDNDVFDLRHIGSLYRGTVPDLTPLLYAIRQLLDRDPAAAKDFRMSFIGSIDDTFKHQLNSGIQHYNLADNVHLQPAVSHQQATDLMCTAGALMVALSDDPGMELALRVKTFEYLRAKRPILGLVAPSAAYDLLKTMDSAALLSPDDDAAISQQLQTWLQQWRDGTLPVPTNSGYDQFERRALTGQLAQVFDNILDEVGQQG